MIQILRHSWHLFEPILAGAKLKDRLIGCLGATLGMALAAFICKMALGPAVTPWLVAPVGASAVLLFAIPASPLAQPWPIIGGNIISATVGVVAAGCIGSVPAAVGVAVGGAILAMSLLRCLHPPGGAAALTAVIGGKSIAALGMLFPLVPIGLNSFLLVLIGLTFHRFSGHSYPHRAAPAAGHSVAPIALVDLQPSDLNLALEDLGETFDIGREDLELLFRQVEFHANERRRASVA
jgi:CBS domain-containing membrane protein